MPEQKNFVIVVEDSKKIIFEADTFTEAGSLLIQHTTPTSWGCIYDRLRRLEYWMPQAQQFGSEEPWNE